MSEELFGGVVPSGSPDFRSELAAKLAELIPEVIADGKVDVVKLQELLGSDAVEDKLERFGLFWPGKRRALQAAQESTTATLVPDIENSRDWDTTGNVFIEGDNLEVLKILQRHYHGKIKMIYIDPPYNTGKDFVYPDNYKEGLASYLEWTKQVNEEGKKISTNSDTDGRYHSNWLSMMYPRLKLAKNLLTEDGVIFVSIGDAEVQNLKTLMLEVFGENNFEGQIHWRRRHNQPNDPTKMIAVVAEHILVFSKNPQALKISGVGKVALTGNFTNPDNDPRGSWNSKPWKVGANQSGSTHEITLPNGERLVESWMGEEATFHRLLEEGRIYFPKAGGGLPRKKIYEAERVEEGQAGTNWFPHETFGSNQEGTAELEDLFEGEKGVFDNPKPTKLLSSLMGLANLKNGDTVLDFFAGSGSSGHAAMQFSLETQMRINFIQVQLPEPTPEGSVPRLLGYKTISALSRERLQRAALDVKTKAKSDDSGPTFQVDFGIRAYKLAESNFPIWRVPSGVGVSELEKQINEIAYSSAEQANSFDCLIEVLIKLGFSLNVPLKLVDSSVFEVYLVGDGSFLAVVRAKKEAELSDFATLLDLKPARLLVMEDAYSRSDELKTNLEQECNNREIELIKK